MAAVEFIPTAVHNRSSEIGAVHHSYNYSILEMSTNSTYNVNANIEQERVQDLIYLTLYSVTFLASFIGNSIICYVVFGKSNMRNFTNVLLANMAISDILCGLMFPLGLIICWDSFINSLGHHACITAKVVQLLSFQVSSVTMTVVALDRFMLVNYPLLRTHRILPVYIVIISVWIIALIIIAGTSPTLAFHRYFTPNEPYIKCEAATVFDISNRIISGKEQRIRLIIANLAHFWIPLVVIFACYGSITLKVMRRKVGNMTSNQQNALLRAKWKTIKMLIAAVAVFFLCWFPFFILNLMDFIGNPQRKRPCNKSGTFFIAVWLAFTSCCWNPFVYWIYNEDFRGGLKEFSNLFKMQCKFSLCTIRDSNSQESPKLPDHRGRNRTITLSTNASEEL